MSLEEKDEVMNRVIPLELVDDTSLAKREHMLVELRLVR